MRKCAWGGLVKWMVSVVVPVISVLGAILALAPTAAVTQTSTPELVDPNLSARLAMDGLVTPITMAFIAPNRFLVLEKNTGIVWHVEIDNASKVHRSVALDLSVNFGSERGLLGIALHPQFSQGKPWVYLFWTCRTTTAPTNPPWIPVATLCNDANMTGLADTDDLVKVPLLGNRVDRFVWNSTSMTLAHASRLISLRSLQYDAAPVPPGQGDADQPIRGNHDGGVMRFGPEGKLYIIFGDQGRRGWLQNLQYGPTTGTITVPDDQFGGPEPDNAHFS